MKMIDDSIVPEIGFSGYEQHHRNEIKTNIKTSYYHTGEGSQDSKPQSCLVCLRVDIGGSLSICFRGLSCYNTDCLTMDNSG
jgi:hypothetical protein